MTKRTQRPGKAGRVRLRGRNLGKPYYTVFRCAQGRLGFEYAQIMKALKKVVDKMKTDTMY
ncbi:hypothetical protein P4H87_07495 [Paenibacillus macerans]|uniref:hypothetical protein n=1 Tax=Paenibacillus macerans TaxID=44252 RepID=UPI002DB8B64C|nr:hypothetical protein [Paenibacillus macerans]MEC0150431.1 hypothetical protein [Paenibacillus macerans]